MANNRPRHLPTAGAVPDGTFAPRYIYLDAVDKADCFPYQEKEPHRHDAIWKTLYKLQYANGDVIGYMLDSTLEKLLELPESLRGEVIVDKAERTVRAFEQPTEEERNKTVAAVMAHWRQNKTFDVLRGWRDELWPVYCRQGSSSSSSSSDLTHEEREKQPVRVAYSVERSATGMLGVTRYGVHMTGYVADPSAPHGMRIWVPRRAADKSTYPGMLDNTVAGGLMTGEDPFECIVREANEEASLPEDLMRQRAKYAGMVTYIYITDERAGGESGQIYPETQWVYDVELPPDFRPQPNDGEVADFTLMTVDEVREELARGHFKPNCGLVIVDFFVRHGIITRENEPDYDEIVERMHRYLPFPGPHSAYNASRAKAERP
ncbi:NUDIX hydrolase domain-like protein [Xylariaceae sp. FL0594]|nr:NUDIX hydrolase domain-like protein [Xylariaceae sp. FL0594]